MSKCTTQIRSVLQGYDPQNNVIYLYQPRCKMWSCPACAVTNKLLWQAKIGYGYEWYSMREIQDWRFVTITAHRKNKTAAQCLYVFPKAWAKLSARMRRKFAGMKYVILPEHHEDGRVHWHMICSGGMSTRWLKDNCAYTGLGYMGKSEPVNDSLRAIMYVSKYIGKSMIDQKWPENLRRIRTNQKWPELPASDEFDPLEVDWTYMHQYPAEGLVYIAHELELSTGIKVKVLSPSSPP